MRTILFSFFILSALFCCGQDDSQNNVRDVFKQLYPIGDNPNIGYKTSMVPKKETILFEANPILRMSLYNNMYDSIVGRKSQATALYLGFRPQLRMYSDRSKPVKMPSYRISILGFQKLFRLKMEGESQSFFAFSLESGHYSNGQSRCAYNSDIDDGTVSCDSVFATLTPTSNLSDLLNRSSGNFSTNYTEIIANYQLICETDNYYVPKTRMSVKLGYTRYHDLLLGLADIGGYSADDIKIYGKNRIQAGAEFVHAIPKRNCLKKCLKIDRYSLSTAIEYISKPHPWVNPMRFEATGTVYWSNNLGFFISFITGHDNYNYRFVDSGSQIFTGITFDVFPPIPFNPPLSSN